MPNVRYLNERESKRSAGNRDVSRGESPADNERGRGAASPWQIPWQGWKDILVRTYEQINEDRLLAVAAGVVFYGLLALFPAITALVSSYALFAKPSTINDHLSMLSDVLPAGALTSSKTRLAEFSPKVILNLERLSRRVCFLRSGAPTAA
jgi:membrane protein